MNRFIYINLYICSRIYLPPPINAHIKRLGDYIARERAKSFFSHVDYSSIGKKGVMLIEKGNSDYHTFNASFLQNMVSLMAYSILNGYLPHIELKGRKQGWINWDTFFEQPFNTKKSEVSCVCDRTDFVLSGNFRTVYQPRTLRILCDLFQHLVILNKQTKEYIDNDYSSIICPDMKVLGVCCRGTDYLKLRPAFHPVQPDINDVIIEAQRLIEECGFSHIYLATEEEEYEKMFRKVFGGIVITNKRHYIGQKFHTQGLSWCHQVNLGIENEKYVKGLEYLSSMVILSRCKGLIGGNCGGSKLALMLSNLDYEYWHLWDLGLYPSNKMTQ